MYAQFAVIAAIGAAGVMTFWTSDGTDRRSAVNLRLKQYDDLAKEQQARVQHLAEPAEGEERT